MSYLILARDSQRRRHRRGDVASLSLSFHRIVGEIEAGIISPLKSTTTTPSHLPLCTNSSATSLQMWDVCG